MNRCCLEYFRFSAVSRLTADVCGLDLRLCCHSCNVEIEIVNAGDKIYIVDFEATVIEKNRMVETICMTEAVTNTLYSKKLKYAPRYHVEQITVYLTINRVTVIDVQSPHNYHAPAKLLFKDKQSAFVSKDVLSLHSPYFSELFKEQKEEYELNEVGMHTFLKVYSIFCNLPMSYERLAKDENMMETTIGLLDRFQCDHIKYTLENELLLLDEEKAKKWLKPADKHGLKRLVSRVIHSMSKEEFGKLATGKNVFNEFSMETVHKLFKKMQSLCF
ncbi:hypothetical protein L596_017466 [Steinernema carpocapsae]|uniref:BTB domain-containing protein n=1 Tax=Steinernema carpocapsae TaxID=34508 RepID=A0A4U5N211_STECR|nr:hypothetical protein L596_017466 [Steinernema carpocapsae]